MMRRRSGGFTLIEMMVVVAILGILTTLVVVTVNHRIRPVDVASQFASLVADASRVAVRGGPVRADVALGEATQRRSRIVGTMTGTTVAFTVEVLVEEANDATPRWDVVRGITMPATVAADDFAMAVGARASLTRSSDWNDFVLSCFPDGSCSASSLFFSSSNGATSDRYARVSVLPLGTATYVKKDWN